MKNQKGFAEVAILYGVIALIAILFIPNPVSKFVGVGVQPNKTIQKDTTTLITDKEGVPIAYRNVTTDDSVQQHVTFWQWLSSLPIMVIILMGAGVVFPVVGVFLHKMWSNAVAAYNDLTGETKRIVVSVKLGLATIQDPAVKQKVLDAMSAQQDQSTKDLVKELLKS